MHIAGTDFDRRVELAAILPEFGYGAFGPSIRGAPPREVPSGVYFDLATWHLINTVYSPQRVAELRSMRDFYANARHHERLMTVVTERLGHELAARAEGAKIAVAEGGSTRIDLSHVERALGVTLDEREAVQAIEADSSASSMQRASRCSRPACAGPDRRALLHRRLDRSAPAGAEDRRRVPGCPRGARRPLCQRGHGSGDVRAALVRRAPAHGAACGHTTVTAKPPNASEREALSVAACTAAMRRAIDQPRPLPG